MEQPDVLINEAAKIYKVLSNSTRIKILYYLRHQTDEVDVKTIVNDLGLAQPVVSPALSTGLFSSLWHPCLLHS